eukprot:scaffold312_cov256-Pinguiococcus_pyrenoidosus.AAC.13
MRGPQRPKPTSACGCPALGWKPWPTTVPSLFTMTQPTGGLGLVRPLACVAKQNKRRISRKKARNANLSHLGRQEQGRTQVSHVRAAQLSTGDQPQAC